MATRIIGAAPSEVPNVGATKPPKVAAPKAKPKPKPKPKAKPRKKKPTSKTAKYLAGDTTYQRQLSDYNRSKADYEANYKRQTGIVSRDYGQSARDLNRQGAQDRIDQQNDFAGRGILHSGVFAKALGDYNTEFNSRYTNLQRGKTDQIGDMVAQRRSFLTQLAIEQANAREDALRRRAAKLGI